MLKKWDVTIPALSGDTPRKAYIYLPDAWEENPEKRYPVLYMFDGHNIFLDEDAAFGKSWGMKRFMDDTQKELIIVAVECNHQGNRRLSEYAPFSYRNKAHGFIEGNASVLLDWMVNTLKPHIDKNYPTIPDREHTILAGSSMGGLIALYGVLAYNHIFQRAACLSPSLWVCPRKVLAMIAKNRMAPDTVLYMDYGQQEVGNHKENKRILRQAVQLLMKKKINLAFRIIKNGNHSEASWEKQVPVFMECLGL